MSSITLIAAKTTTGPGPWAPIRRPDLERTFQVSIDGAATISIEVSNDGKNAVALATNIANSAGYQDDGAWHYVRVNVTAITSGGVTVVMGEKA